ncbi:MULTISPECIES: phospholipase D-like domain-containing protein [Comamonas]|uniref:phospholipase D-like domain-containing protein n=1 Tax=Comamonas TaxID=283 RepID=UPI0025C24FF8|nr:MULTISPECIES: phospholipase D family protein [Comamonas]MEB5965496.1 phospholipase D family protein [Comamonas testosteroni]
MTAFHSISFQLKQLRRSRHPAAVLCCTLAAMLLTGCAASLPKEVERPVSTALSQPQSTDLGLLIAQARPAKAKPDASAFALISGPRHAFSSRMALVQNAQKTLDLQYYAIHADQSTGQLLRAVVQAARRGVRVRVLLDDFHSTGPDAQVMRLAFVPNVEMRMFNPLAGSRASSIGRAWTLLTDFQRAQQRMHNKLFVADNTLAVIGGRNLGDAYFDASDVGNFVDLDVLTGGPVVKELSRSFDRYWNNVRAYPVQSLISEPDLLKLKTQFDQEDASSQEETAPGVTAPEDSPLNLNQIPWIWAQAMVLADSPAKIPVEGTERAAGEPPLAAAVLDADDAYSPPPSATPALNAESVVDGLLALIRSAKQDLLVVSPYFVPGPEIMDAFRAARSKGVRIRVLTNSLASNDAPLAHAGYARHRKALLEMGIELHEMRSEAANVRSALRAGGTGSSGGSAGASRAMLHTKLLVIDGRLVAVGSMNLDMRSQRQNTEIAVLIASRRFSQLAGDSINESLPENSWRVDLDPRGQLVWRAPQGSGLGDSSSEPDASLGLRLMLQLLGPLAPDSLL